MNPRHAASVALQSPSGAAWRDPSELVGRDVCPHCKRPVVRFDFATPDGHRVSTSHCPEHGDVAPMRSHVSNAPPAPQESDRWSK